ncbi:MAG: hypothetical protein M3Q55_09305 [Acidobacteriota bacterium]|nr:hypothetical protein [Acidobacteriota bacterium]
MSRAEVLAILRAAHAAPVAPVRASGCGRAYVCVSTSDKDLLKAVAVACKALGLLFERRGHYGTGSNSIYIGYDNCDGRAIGKSIAIAAALSAAGIPAYDDAVAD